MNAIAPATATGDAGTVDRSMARPVDLVLARVHLRLGSLPLARAELEILAGRGLLDMAGHVDLAEARWRTGDVTGAGEAAAVALNAGEDAPIALAIAAEAAAALGRPNEARRLATRAMERGDGSIDDLFAGMPRSAVWPADSAEPPPTAGTLFHHEPEPGPARRASDRDDVTALRAPAGPEPRSGAPALLTLGLWDPDPTDDAAGQGQPDPAGEVEAARAALVEGALEDACLRFSLALRMAPALAPAVLEATDGISTPGINLVRGDAYRLVGLETEARRAYAAAAWSGARDRRRGSGLAGEARDSSPAGDGGSAPDPEERQAGKG